MEFSEGKVDMQWAPRCSQRAMLPTSRSWIVSVVLAGLLISRRRTTFTQTQVAGRGKWRRESGLIRLSSKALRSQHVAPGHWVVHEEIDSADHTSAICSAASLLVQGRQKSRQVKAAGRKRIGQANEHAYTRSSSRPLARLKGESDSVIISAQ